MVLAVAMLLISLFPAVPLSTIDQRYHLQARGSAATSVCAAPIAQHPCACAPC